MEPVKLRGGARIWQWLGSGEYACGPVDMLFCALDTLNFSEFFFLPTQAFTYRRGCRSTLPGAKQERGKDSQDSRMARHGKDQTNTWLNAIRFAFFLACVLTAKSFGLPNLRFQNLNRRDSKAAKILLILSLKPSDHVFDSIQDFC